MIRLTCCIRITERRVVVFAAPEDIVTGAGIVFGQAGKAGDAHVIYRRVGPEIGLLPGFALCHCVSFLLSDRFAGKIRSMKQCIFVTKYHVTRQRPRSTRSLTRWPGSRGDTLLPFPPSARLVTAMLLSLRGLRKRVCNAAAGAELKRSRFNCACAKKEREGTGIGRRERER